MPADQPPSPLDRLRAELARPRGVRRVDALLSAPDPAAAVAALSPTEVYEIVHEAGFHDAADLIPLATPEQIRGCMDIDLWDRDQLLLDAATPWLTALLEAGYEKLGEAWAGLDAEMRALLMQRHTVIYDLSIGEEPDDSDDRPIYVTPDRFLAVKLLGNEDTIRLVMGVLDDLYRADSALARHTLMAARAEPPAELEETAYRWRAGRMADLGFVDFYEALDLFQPLEPDKIHVGEGTQDRFEEVLEGDDAIQRNLPVAIAEHVVGHSFLARALDRIGEPAEVDRLQQAVLVLVNRVMSAARVRPGDLEALRRGAIYAIATVSLGLETIARGDLDRAAQALTTVSLTRLHRAGYTVTLRLSRFARTIAPRAATAGLPATAVLAGLTAARPWLARVIDTPPMPGVRPFESQADVRHAAEILARLALRIALVETLGVNLIAMGLLPEPRPSLDDHIRTAMVRAMTGGPFRGDALTQDELRAFRTDCLVGGELVEDARRRGQAAVLARLEDARITAGREHLPGLVFDWLADIERILGEIADDVVDPRFVEGILVETGRRPS